jgi:hypothetical protein
MKKLMVILLLGCALVINPDFRKVALADGFGRSHSGEEIPLSALAGTYAMVPNGSGSIALCFESASPYPPAPCDSPNLIVGLFTTISVGAETFDHKGNSCGTMTGTFSNLPLGASPPAVSVSHITATTTSWDPTLGTGDQSVTSWVGGQCHGATFDSTGATVESTLTAHLTASDHGNRVDYIITSATNAVGSIGAFSLSGYLLRH